MRTCEFVPKVFIAFQENLGFQIDGRRFFSVICKNASHHTEEPFWNIRSRFTRFVYFAHAANGLQLIPVLHFIKQNNFGLKTNNCSKKINNLYCFDVKNK